MPMSLPATGPFPLVRALLCFALAACSARGGDGSFTPPTGDGGSSASVSFTCEQLCAGLAAEPTCGAAGVATCRTSCSSQLTAIRSECVATANALYACAQTATPQCSTSTTFPYPACLSQASAYASCVASSSGTDAGTTTPTDSGTAADPCASATSCSACTARSACGWCGGRCRVGTGSGPSTGSCGEASWAWTSNQCSTSNPPADAGVMFTPACQSCVVESCTSPLQACAEDPACAQCLGSPTPACTENANFARVASCGCEVCREPCGSLCAMLR